MIKKAIEELERTGQNKYVNMIEPISGTKFGLTQDNKRKIESVRKLIKENDDRRNKFKELLIEEMENGKNNKRNN